MKARPILFSPEMILALLEGRKSQTRRICKPQPHSVGDEFSTRQHGTLMIRGPQDECWAPVPCPYGKPRDLLWVRERSWAWGRWLRNGTTKTGRQKWRFRRSTDGIRFEKPETTAKRNGKVGWVYRHARFMRRQDSRLTLKITDVRVQRVQEISEADAKEEGFNMLRGDGITAGYLSPHEVASVDGNSPRRWFANLWNSINAARGFGWDANPWVWAVTFEVIAQNVDAYISGRVMVGPQAA